MNKYTEYAEQVLNGQITACTYIKLACKRYLAWMEREDIEFIPSKADKVVNFCQKLKHFTGRFNGKNFILEPFQKWIIYSIYGFYYKGTEERVVKNVWIELARKNGKALALDTPIPTPTGYTTMGELNVGDYVLDKNGNPTQVTYVTPTMYDHKCYEVTFSDGEVITCDADHNWYVDRYHRRKYHVETTQNIVDKGYWHYRKDGHKEYYVSIPCAKLKDQKGKRNNKTIRIIKEVESVPVKCITVNSPNHLYLCGLKNTVTHNTFFAAALGLYALIGDGENNSEVELIANSKKQAQICFDMCSNIISKLDPRHKYFKPYRDKIKFDYTKSFLQVLSSDSGCNDGWNSYCFIADEVHAYPDSKMFDVMKSSQGMRDNPLAISITTAGFNLFSFAYTQRKTNIEILYGQKEDDSQFSAIYTLDEDDDFTDESVWVKANPNLNVTVKPQYLREQIQQAKNNPSLEISTRTKNFNQWLATSTIWLNNDVLMEHSKKVDLNDYKDKDLVAYVGVDLSAVSDLTAVSVMIPTEDKLIFKNFYYLPKSVLVNNSNAEKYKFWATQGLLTLTQGNVTDYDYITNDIVKINEIIPIQLVAYDRYNATTWSIQMTELGMPMQAFSQSMMNFTIPTKTLERNIKMGNVIIDDNEMTRWCFGNVVLKYDWNDNCRPIKEENQQKIDGVVAMLQAVGGYLSVEHYNNEIFGFNMENPN